MTDRLDAAGAVPGSSERGDVAGNFRKRGYNEKSIMKKEVFCRYKGGGVACAPPLNPPLSSELYCQPKRSK